MLADENLTRILHPMEVLLIDSALEMQSDTVLVDIFERRADGSINVVSGDVKTHTVVLHRQGSLVLLIDPTNSEYSQHLALGVNKLLTDAGMALLAPDKKLEIYTPKQEATGKGAEKTRDCVDIATKIALQLQMPDTPKLVARVDSEPITIETWKAWAPLVAISNRNITKDLTEEYAAPFDGSKPFIPLRIKQSSDDGIRNKFMDVRAKIQNLFKLCKTIEVSEAQMKSKEDQMKVIEDHYKACLGAPHIGHTEFSEMLNPGLIGVYDQLQAFAAELLGRQSADLHTHIDSI